MPPSLCCSAALQALLANNSITELTIRGNDLGDEGVEALATALIVSSPGLGWVTGLLVTCDTHAHLAHPHVPTLQPAVRWCVCSSFSEMFAEGQLPP
jgi:hypothetical protein